MVFKLWHIIIFKSYRLYAFDILKETKRCSFKVMLVNLSVAHGFVINLFCATTHQFHPLFLNSSGFLILWSWFTPLTKTLNRYFKLHYLLMSLIVNQGSVYVFSSTNTGYFQKTDLFGNCQIAQKIINNKRESCYVL